MIKHHPSEGLLTQYCAGELPFSLSIGLSAHIEMCPHCQGLQQEMEALQAEDFWGGKTVEHVDFSDMLHGILATPVAPLIIKPKPILSVEIVGKQFNLPNAFASFKNFSWAGFGMINRARVVTDENNVRSSLLHINAGGEIPTHQHKGYELTLLLDGSFSDEYGTYSKGDFILLDGDIKHSPKTKKGCLCYTVQDAPLHFIHGMSKVLNPLGKLIY
ncbi:MAG: ChrR family anti-sigma-E factor [Moritella sp.]|uniref:ChrR family anti-sigma-E factor n=1 Tax=Moritella sp. TaxID=78556 RepID=UPI0029A01B1E|nr:ChrR family anti-sigma-E factor [Moritella sp.]MDX2319844.1 ChrR family anti-sigma-E factor [Moritella sp.]